MLKYTLIILLATFSITTYCQQSGFGVTNSRVIFSTSRISPHNAWIGSQLQYDFNQDNSLSNNFLFNVKTLYSLRTKGKLQLPIIGNVGIPLGDNSSTVQVGLFPWSLVHNNSIFSIVAHGGAEYEVYPGENLSTSVQHFNLSAGIEVAVWMQQGLPLTLSATPIYSFRNLDLDDSFYFELTGIVPITNGMGFMIDSRLGKKSILAAGLIINNPIN